MSIRRYALLVMIMFSALGMNAQFYTGMSGLIHVPSAETFEEGDLRVGGYYMNRHFTPGRGFKYGGKLYDTGDFYLTITPFRWIELGYAFALMKSDQGSGPKYNSKDRFLSFKVTPWKETKYLPSVSVGANDFLSTFNSKNDSKYQEYIGKSEYFLNYYVAVTKHIDLIGQRFGATLAFRHFKSDENNRWNGVVGGVTWQPGFAPDGRMIVEWDGCRVNAGIDYTLWKHLCMQVAFIDCRYFSGGLCYRVNLF